jgi:hypothetical protein
MTCDNSLLTLSLVTLKIFPREFPNCYKISIAHKWTGTFDNVTKTMVVKIDIIVRLNSRNHGFEANFVVEPWSFFHDLSMVFFVEKNKNNYRAKNYHM